MQEKIQRDNETRNVWRGAHSAPKCTQLQCPTVSDQEQIQLCGSQENVLAWTALRAQASDFVIHPQEIFASANFSLPHRSSPPKTADCSVQFVTEEAASATLLGVPPTRWPASQVRLFLQLLSIK